MSHQPGNRPQRVHSAQADAIVRDTAGRVGRAVNRVDNDSPTGRPGAQARFLAQHADTGRVEHAQRSGVGDLVECVLIGPVAADAPTIEGGQRRLNGVGGSAQ